MKLFKYLILAVSFAYHPLVLAADPVFGTDAETKYARELKVPANKALVYIYMRDRDGNAVTPKIFLNNYEIGRLAPGSFTVWQLAPGQLDVRVDGTQPATFSVTSQAGKVYLFRVAIIQTATGPQAQLTSLPATYRSDLTGTQLLKNPRDVSARIAAAPVAPPVTDKQATSTKAVEAQAVNKQAAGTATPPTPGKMALLLRSGALSLASDTQTIFGQAYRFDDSASGIIDIEYTYQITDSVTVGGELISYTTNFTRVGTGFSGQVDTLLLSANAKQYFRTQESLQPYVGAGIGLATNDVSGDLTGSTAGVAFHASIGIEYRFDNIALSAEYKYISANTEDDGGHKIDVSTSGVLAGIGFRF